METMQSWFGLTDEHVDFSVENDRDARFLFARQRLDDTLASLLTRAFRKRTPPKLVLYGDWGVGKTHTMRHIEHVINETDDYGAQVVFVEAPDIQSKSTFQVAHAAFMDAVGLDRVAHWMTQFRVREDTESTYLIRDMTQSADIANAFETLLARGEVQRTAWDWLRGEKLAAADARGVGLPQELSQSKYFVNVLRLLGVLSERVDGKMLVLMLDEATKVEDVTNGDAINHWRNAMKELMDDDNKEVGLIASISLRDPDVFPEAFADEQVRTRLGERNLIELHTFDEEETRIFVESLLDEFVDDTRAGEFESEYSGQTDGEDIAHHPFTDAALSLFVEFACRRGVATPRDIQKDMDDMLNRAMDDGRRILSSDYVQDLIAMG